ncbi:MAG: hypothetical protein WD468_12280 [Pirellulales bacterium]
MTTAGSTVTYARAILAFALALPMLADPASADPFATTWSGMSGNWSNPNRWIPIGIVPNNIASLTYAATINSGTATTDIPVNLSQLIVRGGSLNLIQTLHTSEMTIRGGSVVGPGKLNIDGDLILRGGIINNTANGPDGFLVGGKVIKRGYGKGTLAPFSSFDDYEIVIEQGKFRGSNGFGGGTALPITIGSAEFARLEQPSSSLIEDDIYLNNARGFNGTGALVSGEFPSAFTGDIYLGEIGATLGVISGDGTGSILTLRGNIHGGTLETTGNGIIQIEGSGHTYSGPTHIGIHGKATTLVLRNAGEMRSTSGFDVGGNATLELDNVNQNNVDRVPDHAAIQMRGGTIEIRGAQTVPTPQVFENMGALQLEQGASTVRLRNLIEYVSFDSLQRSGTATIDFVLSLQIAQAWILLDEAPVITNGYIGGWATYRGDDFATYDSTRGVVGLLNTVVRPTQIDSAGSSDHVQTSGTTIPLSANRTITSLLLKGGNVDLAGFRLTITGGGLINGSTNTRQISNGVLTAGDGSSPANLYVRCLEITDVSATISDNGVAGPVSLVKTGFRNLNLSGANNHSGATIVQEGTVQFTAEQAVSSSSEIIVDGGTVSFQYTPTAPTKIPKLTLKQSGIIDAPVIAGTKRSAITLDANEVVLESGNTNISFSGNGTMRKLTDGVAEVSYDSPNFMGSVIVERGTLVAGSRFSSVRSPQALGTGTATINSAGSLVHSAVDPSGVFMQLNTALHLAGGTVGIGTLSSASRWDFNREWLVTNKSRLLMFDPLANNEITLPTVNLLQTTTLADAAELSILGEGTLNFAGGVSITGDATLNVIESSANLSAISSIIDGGKLHLSGGGTFQIPRVLTAATGKSLMIDVSSGATATPSAGSPFSIDDRISLSINGRLANTQPLILNGGTLQGGGTTGNVTNIEAIVSPGNSVGVLTVGVFNQGIAGGLHIELLGGPNHASDQLRAQTASLSGVVNAVLMPNAQIIVGDVFNVLIANQIQTSNLQLSTSGFNALLKVVNLTSGADAGRMSLQLTIVPEPLSIALLLAGMFMVWQSLQRCGRKFQRMPEVRFQ